MVFADQGATRAAAGAVELDADLVAAWQIYHTVNSAPQLFHRTATCIQTINQNLDYNLLSLNVVVRKCLFYNVYLYIELFYYRII